MSEAENHPPASSVTALRIPIIKKGEYDLWCMKMRQYIAITDHILWDIITNGDQATTEPASASDRHLLSFHDAQDAKSLWAAIKARFGAREELDSAYDRFQNIISMLELYDAKVSCEDANLKFLRSLPSVWHVVATMIRGQPGLDELDFDDLYNNLKVTSRQSTADDSEIITKGYAQASSSKLKETLNSSFNSDEIICSFFAQQASMPETHDDEDLLQIDDDAMEEIDIRWQVAMITARIRKANRANGSKEKRIVPIEDSNSKALVAKDSQGEIDWTKEFDDDPMDLSVDWSEEADNAPVALALMATSSTDSSNSDAPSSKKVFYPISSTYKGRPNVSKAVLSQSTARPYFPRPVFSTSTGRPYYPRMDNVRPRASSSSPPTGFFNTRTVDRPKSPKPIIKSKWVKKESTAGTQAVLPQTKGEKGSVVTRQSRRGTKRSMLFWIVVALEGSITGKGTIKTSCIDFENVSYVQLFGSQYWNDEPIATFKGRTACKVWTLKEDLMLFLRGERNADFHEVIDFLTGWLGHMLLLVSPDVIQQFWNTAKVRMINEVAHIEAKVARKKILVSEASVRTDLMFNDEDGTTLSKSSSWDQFGTNIASALVGLATNQKFNFSKLIFDGMLRNLKDSKPFLMYPVAMPVRAEHSLHTEELDITTSSHHSDDSSAGEKAESPSPVASERPASPNDYTPTDEVQTSGGDEGNLDLYGLTREVLRLKKQNAKQAAQILRLKTKIKILVKKVKPVIAEYRSFVKIKATLSKKKKLKKAHKKKSSSFKQGRKKVSDGSTGLNEVDVNSGDSQMMDVDDTISAEVHEGTAEVHEGTAQVNEGTAEVNEGTAEVNESTAGANLSTEPSMKEVEDEAGPSTFQDESDEFIQDDTLIADILVNITRPRRGAGITIPGNIPEQERPESPTLILDPKDKAAEMQMDEKLLEKLQLNDWEKKEERIDMWNVGGKAYRNLKNKSYEEIKDIYEKVKRFNDKFVAIGSTEDEQAIKEMNVKAEEPSKKRNRANGHIRAFNTLNEVLHILDRQDLHHLHRLVIEYYEHIPPTGLGLILYGDLTTMMETTKESDDELWRNQTEWEIIRWRLYESTGVHILELENGTMIHMLVEQRYPLTRELMQRMLEHKLEVQRETEDALNIIRFVMKQKEDLEREEE
ncbi:hypothetical protein Tco_0211074 [Tanacetum coccineum]